MSKAKPMDADRRALHYVLNYDEHDEYTVRGMTGPQRRRWKHKLHRTGEQWPADGKGRPTPRRPRRG